MPHLRGVHMLRIDKESSNKSGNAIIYGLLLGNDALDGGARFVEDSENLVEKFHAWVNDDEKFEDLVSLSCNDVDDRIVTLRVNYPYYFDNDFSDFSISDIEFNISNNKVASVKFDVYSDHLSWTQPWTVVDHLLLFHDKIASKNLEYIDFPDWLSDDERKKDDKEFEFIMDIAVGGYSVVFKASEQYQDRYFTDLLDAFLPILESAHRECITELLLKIKGNSVVTHFNFPEEIKNSCEQYLLYFVKFLKDIGIDAIAEIQEKSAGDVLFSVTPKNEGQALSQIRDALEIYLNLPRNTSITPFGVHADLSIQQLVSNIYHLKSQLALAAATIQQKELLIGQQQSMISNQLLSGEILVKSMA